MRQFKDFGITTSIKSFVGDKIKIERVLNREVTIYAWKIEKSKLEKIGAENCLYLQIGIGDTKYVIFTSGKYLMEAVKQIPENDFPFNTTIIRVVDHFEFS